MPSVTEDVLEIYINRLGLIAPEDLRVCTMLEVLRRYCVGHKKALSASMLSTYANALLQNRLPSHQIYDPDGEHILCFQMSVNANVCITSKGLYYWWEHG